jgi:hypothetical protein
MISHCVLVKFKRSVTTAERDAIYDGLRALEGKIDGLVRGWYGHNASPEGLGQGFDDGFMMDFRDAAARDAYLVDPEHQAAGAKLVDALQDGAGGLIVFDFVVS